MELFTIGLSLYFRVALRKLPTILLLSYRGYRWQSDTLICALAQRKSEALFPGVY